MGFYGSGGMPVDDGGLHYVSIGAGAGVQMKTHHDSSVSGVVI